PPGGGGARELRPRAVRGGGHVARDPSAHVVGVRSPRGEGLPAMNAPGTGRSPPARLRAPAIPFAAGPPVALRPARMVRLPPRARGGGVARACPAGCWGCAACCSCPVGSWGGLSLSWRGGLYSHERPRHVALPPRAARGAGDPFRRGRARRPRARLVARSRALVRNPEMDARAIRGAVTRACGGPREPAAGRARARGGGGDGSRA